MRLVCFSFLSMALLLTMVSQGMADEAQRVKTVAKGLEYLKNRGQAVDGAVSPRMGIGVTALAAQAMLRNGVPTSDPSLAKALALVAGSAREDGGIYAEQSRLKMYETCVAMLCLKTANTDGRYDSQLRQASAYVKGEQFDEADGKDPSDPEYGGTGYGGKSAPDLSNTAFFIEALKSMGDPENDEAIAKALTFVSRCQNLEGPYNSGAAAGKVNDGGFYYNVIGDGTSAAGETTDGGLRSYGSMSYAGFKSMLYAGLAADDPRVKAARTWIEQNYTVQENPGLGEAGLYYYYHLFAKALVAAKIDVLTDAQGVKHDWRAELIEHLAGLQAEDGSWTNNNTRWMEGDPNLATTFCLLALSYCGEEK